MFILQVQVCASRNHDNGGNDNYVMMTIIALISIMTITLIITIIIIMRSYHLTIITILITLQQSPLSSLS